MGSYLELPKNLGSSKIQVLNFVPEHLNIRINGWTFKFFTKGGKEVVIKSVVTILPNHVMSCYHLPKVTKKLTSAVAQFWWSLEGTQKACNHPRPANKNQQNIYPGLTLDSLIDPVSRT